MTAFDLGEARRRRDGYEPKRVTVTGDDGETLFDAEVAAEIPAAALDAGSEGRMVDAIRSLFLHDEDAARFLDQFKPSIQDLAAMFENLYGQGELGEALASGSESTSDGTR